MKKNCNIKFDFILSKEESEHYDVILKLFDLEEKLIELAKKYNLEENKIEDIDHIAKINPYLQDKITCDMCPYLIKVTSKMDIRRTADQYFCINQEMLEYISYQHIITCN